MWGRAAPNASFRPIYASPSYPEQLLNKTQLKQEGGEMIPLLQAWEKQEETVIKKLIDVPLGQQGKWLGVFKESLFNKVCTVGCYDIRAQYMTCLCITDPNTDLSDEQISGYLAVTVPLIHGVLGKIWRKSHRTKQKQLHDLLTKREVEILSLVKKGKTNPEISTILGVTFPTIKNHLQNIMIKMRVNNRAQAVGKAFGQEPADTKLLEEAWPAVERGASSPPKKKA